MDEYIKGYETVDTDAEYHVLAGDIVYHPQSEKVELLLTPSTDLIQTEFYPMIENFGCILLRKPDRKQRFPSV